MMLLMIALLVLVTPPSEVSALRQQYQEVYTYEKKAKAGQSFTMNEDNSLNLCTCDVTKGACDAYCCCDEADCDKDILAFWKESYNTYCQPKNAISQQYKSQYSACVAQTMLKKWNAVDGMAVTERDGQACVSLNIPSFFSEYKAAVDAAKYQKEQAALKPDYQALTIAQKTFNTRYTSKYTAFYLEGDQMSNQTEETTNGRVSKLRQPPHTFFLTQPVGFNGYCSHNLGVAFMKDIDHDNSCLEPITDLKTASETLLNFKTYYSADFQGKTGLRWGVASGIGATKAIEVKLGEVWVRNSQTNVLTREKKDGEALKAALETKYSAGCSVANAVMEVYYEVRYSPVIDSKANSELYGYQVISAKADVVLLDKLEFTTPEQTKYCEPGGDTKYDELSGVKVTFKTSIKFRPQIEPTLAQNEFYRSGNPGYQTEMPLIIGQEADIAKPQKVAKEGTRLFSHKENGECFKETPGQTEDVRAKIIQFEQQTVLECRVKKSKAELKSYCTGADKDAYKELKIFKQLSEKLQYVAMLGSPSLLKKGDWVKILKSADTAKKWDDKTQTCSGVIGYDIQFQYSSLGFKNRLQHYILGAKIAEIKGDWTYYSRQGEDPATQHSYKHVVQISYHEILNDQHRIDQFDLASWLFPKIPNDIFYPFMLQA